MPTYDFLCNSCNQRFDVFMTFDEYGKKAVICAHCGSKNVRRRITRVRIAKSEDSRMDSMADEFSDFEGLENDPKAMGKMMRKMGKEMGEEVPPEFDEVADRLEAGQSPEEIESSMPDLGGEAGGGEDL
ncbi:MAG TPA: zinc ribbon domain-containing protein [Anaerolineales bacterium]|nr:zinc ribbon domain-containing protein [Anaerolineales bacterium]